MTRHERTLRQYLTAIRDCHELSRKPDGWLYYGYADFLLKHGVLFSHERTPCLSGNFPGKCYAISRHNAETHDGLLYCEGVALCSRTGIPTEHAWNVTDDGRILDEAWSYPGSAYFGVAFKAPRYRKGQSSSLLDRARLVRGKHPVYSVPWESSRLNPSVAAAEETRGKALASHQVGEK
jgi:hypothetical protein